MTRRTPLWLALVLLIACEPEPEFVPEPTPHPLVGSWFEIGRIRCDDDSEFVPDNPIPAIYIGQDFINVTVAKHEVAFGYRANFEVDPAAKTIEMYHVDGGHSFPPHTDGIGRFEFREFIDRESGRLTQEVLLLDMSLGHEAWELPPERSCGHRLGHFMPEYREIEPYPDRVPDPEPPPPPNPLVGSWRIAKAFSCMSNDSWKASQTPQDFDRSIETLRILPDEFIVDYYESHDHPHGTYYVDLDQQIVVLSYLDKVLPDVDPVGTYAITKA